MRTPTDRVHAVTSLQEFFKDSVADAMAKQGVAAEDHTAYYVVNLLTLFARYETLYHEGNPGPGLQPVALLLAAAAETPNREARNALLRRIGDTSLFVAGFLGDGFARKLIDIDYYIDMGGAAYGRLSDSVRGTREGRAFGTVFAELAEKFRDFVDVLAEIRDSGRAAAIDVLRLYEVWLRTGSRRAARLLREHGLEPNATLNVATRH
ncbi:MAG TPA: hypothetical protein VFL84_09615 [Gammaproteobacteria bacterium]|nr:hypothetical protein [Gammaproteobacteria bacterium]